ncbi:hypothetical protein WA026_008844 [Henosepilachna vigintioctopunctata]|uniref:Uncharacterized protein n=1 Tax=Henosepilachna vigintioctopunctata TaxID=420089 RepID=A0AAW1V2Y7_9CUCU
MDKDYLERGYLSKMNCKWRLLLAVVIILILCGTTYFIYNRPKEQGVKLKLSDGIKISVYYEALCPDSKHFVSRQLLPLYQKIPQHITLDLIPYGKAQTIENEGAINFKCQHDEIECYANKIHACVIDMVKDPLIQLNYVACMIRNNHNPDVICKICGEENKVDFNPILNCAKGNEGSLLLKEHGIKTHALNPAASFIPTVELNNSQNIVPLSSILKNLQDAVCGLFNDKPSGCDD